MKSKFEDEALEHIRKYGYSGKLITVFEAVGLMCEFAEQQLKNCNLQNVRLSLPFNDLYKELDDKRMPPHIDSEGVWHLYKKQTAEHLLDNYDIYHKSERQ